MIASMVNQDERKFFSDRFVTCEILGKIVSILIVIHMRKKSFHEELWISRLEEDQGVIASLIN